MSRKSKCLFLMFGLILLVLPVSGCIQRNDSSETSIVSGRVVLPDDGSAGLAGVSLLTVDGPSSYTETDAEGYFKTTAFGNTVVVPRRTGYRFAPEGQVVGEKQELEFAAYPWPEPDFAAWAPQFSFASHRDWVETVAFSIDDQYLATGSNDRTIRIWRVDDGQLVRTLAGHKSAIKVVAFSPNGDYLASGASDGEIKIWDWQTGQEVKALSGHTNQLTDLAWSPGGTKLASSGWDRKVRIWDFTTGTELRSFTSESWVRTVAWSPDGRFVLSGGDDLGLRVWQVDTGELSAEFAVRDKIMYLSTAPEGSLVTMVLGNGELRLLDRETGVETLLEQYQGGVNALSWSFDGRYLAVGTDRLLHVWDAEKRELAQSINAGNIILALGWGSGSHLIATGSYKGIVDLWSVESGANLLKIAGHTGAVKALAWSPQGSYLASGGEEGGIRIWDLGTRKEILQLLPGHSGPIEDLAWSPDGTYLAGAGHDLLVRIWNAAEGEYLGSFTDRLKKPFVTEKGFEFAVGMKSVSHEDIVLSISWAPNGKQLASTSWDQTVAVWDVATRTQLVGMHNPEGWIIDAAWSPHSDQVAFGGYDQAIHIYSTVTGKEIKRLKGHTDWVQSLAWSPDGKYLASSGHDGQVIIWDAATDQIARRFPEDERRVTVVEWSPCGRYLAVGSHSGTVRIWDVGTGEVLYTYPGRVLGLQALAWSPQGDRLAITEGNSLIVLGEPD